jgi:NADH-quinone oxidoreductase subunit L
VLSWGIFFRAIFTPRFGEYALKSSVEWLPFGGPSVAGTTPLTMGIFVDPLAATMLFVVPFICLLIFIYSVGYQNFGRPLSAQDLPGNPPLHGVEPLYSRFFAFLSLFAFAMLLLVVADNLILLFAGWEIMGLCSYLLIGFWYARDYADPKKITPRQAATKAFLVTRIGDVLMLLGIAYLYAQTGTLSFHEIMYANSGVLATRLAQTPSFLVGLSAANLIGLLLFAGTVGKSAQFPLHVWLPDAMEGPTPVSAMIHAATMVSAGVYAMLRVYPLLSVGWHPGMPLPPPMLAMAVIGSITALLAATIAMAQSDIKKVLAYSTISQLGFMVAALGIGAYVAAAFHLVTHAFFKALLFLGSGSVIHGMEHGAQLADPGPTAPSAPPLSFDPQNMFQMGGLREKLPRTFWTFLVGGMALAGFPFLVSGFWSKDEILTEAWAHTPFVFAVLALAAFFTAFYTMRMISLTFLGSSRTPAARRATESKWTMTLPLVALAFFAIGVGWVGIPDHFLGLNLGSINLFESFERGSLVQPPESTPFLFIPLIVSLVVALGGLAAGGWCYQGILGETSDPLAKALGPIFTGLKNKLYFDEAYDLVFVRPIRWIAETFVSIWVDRRLIDGGLHRIGWGGLKVGETLRRFVEIPIINGLGDRTGSGIRRTGQSGRSLQTGNIQEYLLMALTIMILAIAVLFWPALIGR